MRSMWCMSWLLEREWMEHTIRAYHCPDKRDKSGLPVEGNRIMRNTGMTELEAVLAVARRRSFRAAATELGLSTSALSHTVAALEARIGVRLFNRTTRSVALSEAGEQFVDSVAPALSTIRVA